MLLNNFLYKRSLIKNELYQEREKFSIIVPKSTFNNVFIELFDFEKKEHKEEMKEVTVQKGGNRLTDLGVSWVEAASEDMKQRVERGVPEVIVLKQDIEVTNNPEEKVPEKEILSDEGILPEEEILSDEDEEFYDTEQSPNIFNKDIIFDNLKPADEVQESNDVKNVVVSFF
tara:strand:+ start:316 stop:831 length:516 start_codon:yes stop_codon:yes gene_type:complete